MVVHFCKEPIHEHITVNKESYKNSTWRDSNPRPLSHKACALPLSYHHCSWLNLTSDTSWQHNQLVKSISLFQGKAERKLILETGLEKKFSSASSKNKQIEKSSPSLFFSSFKQRPRFGQYQSKVSKEIKSAATDWTSGSMKGWLTFRDIFGETS